MPARKKNIIEIDKSEAIEATEENITKITWGLTTIFFILTIVISTSTTV